MQDNRMELYRQGLGDTEIAAVLGISRITVWRWRKARGLEIEGPGNPNWQAAPDPNRTITWSEAWAIMFGYWCKGQTVEGLAREHGRRAETVEWVVGVTKERNIRWIERRTGRSVI